MKRRPSEPKGRPPEFTDRVRLQVFLERTEYAAIQRAATAAGISASRFMRRAALAALAARPTERRHAR